MAPKLSLLEAYQKAINNPLRRYQRQAEQLRNAMRDLIPLDRATQEGRFDIYPDSNPNIQGPMGGKYGRIGDGTRDRMPGTSPDDKPNKKGKKAPSSYISTPLDPKYGKRQGYI